MRKLCWVWGPGRTTQYGVRPGALTSTNATSARPSRRRFELLLDLLGLVLVHAFLDGLGRGLDEVLGFLEAEAGDRADLLDDVDLLVAGRGRGRR